MAWEVLFLRASRMPSLPASLCLNVKVASLKRATLSPISLFGTTSSRPARHGSSAVPASGASGPLPKVSFGPSTILRFKGIPSTATLDYLLDLLRQYGRVLRVQSPNPIKPAGDLVFVEFEKQEDAVRAKESIERNTEGLFEWKDQEKLATRRVRWKGHPPPKPNRRLQIAFADLPVHRTPLNASILLQLRGLPPGAESAIEIAMQPSQSRVSTAIDGSYYIEFDNVMRAIAIRDEFYGTRHRLASIEGRLTRKEEERVVTLKPILVILSEKGGPRQLSSKPKAILPRIGIDSSNPMDVEVERSDAQEAMVQLMHNKLMRNSDKGYENNTTRPPSRRYFSPNSNQASHVRRGRGKATKSRWAIDTAKF